MNLIGLVAVAVVIVDLAAACGRHILEVQVVESAEKAGAEAAELLVVGSSHGDVVELRRLLAAHVVGRGAILVKMEMATFSIALA